jgi:hypothetical protein
MTPALLIASAWLVVVLGATWRELTRNPCAYEDQLPSHWRPHPRTIVRTHHLTGGRSS